MHAGPSSNYRQFVECRVEREQAGSVQKTGTEEGGLWEHRTWKIDSEYPVGRLCRNTLGIHRLLLLSDEPQRTSTNNTFTSRPLPSLKVWLAHNERVGISAPLLTISRIRRAAPAFKIPAPTGDLILVHPNSIIVHDRSTQIEHLHFSGDTIRPCFFSC